MKLLIIWAVLLPLSWTAHASAEIDPRESLKEVCFGRKDPKCSTVSSRRLIRRRRGKITNTKKLSAKQFAAAKRAIEQFMVVASNNTDCKEPVEIADFVGESLVRVQSYCAPTKVVQTLKNRL